MKHIELPADISLQCWDAQGYVEQINDGTMVKVYIRKPVSSNHTVESLVVDLTQFEKLGLDEASFNDEFHSINNGDVLLLVSFDSHEDDDCATSICFEAVTDVELLSLGQPFYIATRVGGKGKRYKRRSQAIVSDTPIEILNVIITHP